MSENPNYKKMFDEARKKKAVKDLNRDRIKWEKSGQNITGILVGQKEIKSKDSDSTFLVYTVKTDNGLKSFSCGLSVDEIFSDNDYIGWLVSFTYKGKKSLSGGKSYNQFKVEVVNLDEYEGEF